MRLIDADALCAGLVSNHPVVIYAKSEPTVDAVPVVRCKDCKYYEIWQLKADYTDDKRYKPSVCTVGKYSVHRSPDWYCADAERRTDGTD